MEVRASPKEKHKATDVSFKKLDEHAQKDHLRQNNNTPSAENQTSFIPVYTKTTMCHNVPRNGKEEKVGSRTITTSPTKTDHSFQSSPIRLRRLADQIETTTGVTWRTHVRRRSGGIEDVTSISSFASNLSNDKRIQAERENCNLAETAVLGSLKGTNQKTEKDQNFLFQQENFEQSTIPSTNQNCRLFENENNHILRTGRQNVVKDKSSKRKSSLNRMDFIDIPTISSGIPSQQRLQSQQKNSSSDEGKAVKSEFLGSLSKRKHSSPAFSEISDEKKKEVPHHANSVVNAGHIHLLPRTLHPNRGRLKNLRKLHSISQLQKFSHSAGELESLTDELPSPTTKICLSAQEFEPPGSPGRFRKQIRNSRKSSPVFIRVNSAPAESPRRVEDNIASHPCTAQHNGCRTATLAPETPENSIDLSSNITNKSSELNECISIEDTVDLNGSLSSRHNDSRREDDVTQVACRLQNVEISCENHPDNELYISAEETCDSPGFDPERRPSSILRKKFSEERREIHGILKPPPDDKSLRTPPSILKHRESSEEKDVVIQGDLHSILKKSTSEDESSSGNDIRPILKVNTESDESPGCSVRPRPILKKRTSFSEECSYASYPNGELKPILKKTAILSLDEQPRPILKSRRKSEDARSTLSEFIASRPRAYSADMGVKTSPIRLNEPNKEDLIKKDDPDL